MTSMKPVDLGEIRFLLEPEKYGWTAVAEINGKTVRVKVRGGALPVRAVIEDKLAEAYLKEHGETNGIPG